MDAREYLRIHRDALRAAYPDEFSRLAQILFEEDPIGITFEDNTDEYEPEAGTILPRLRRCQTVADVQELLYSDFVRWFDDRTVGGRHQYRRAAERIFAEMAHWRLP